MIEKNVCRDVREYKFDLQANKGLKEEKILKIKNYIENLSDEQKFRFWLKTLFSAYATLPEVIKTIDKIVEMKASSMSFITDIYNVEGSPLNQYKRVIDLTERKNNLLNVYFMVGELYKSLDTVNVEIIEKKYLYGYSCEEVGRELGLSTRTIYRRIDKIIDEVYQTCIRRNWTLAFVESQLKSETWLRPRFVKVVSEYFKNTNYAEDYSMSSSGS